MTRSTIAGSFLTIALVLGLGIAAKQIKRAEDEPVATFRRHVGPKPEGPRRDVLLSALAAAPFTLRELPNGYSMTYDDGQNLLPLAAEWVGLESRRCPFLELSIALMRDHGPLVLKVSGAEGVKPFLQTEIAPLLKPAHAHPNHSAPGKG